MRKALHPAEHAPHGYRAGVTEAVADVRDHEGIWTGRWKPIELVRAGTFTPCPGDLAIYDRSDPANPLSSWWRHVNRVCEWRGDTFQTVGGNEADEVRLAVQRLDNPKLLGFIAYPHDTPEPRPMLTPEERSEMLSEVALSLDGILRDSIAGAHAPDDE